MHEAHTTREWEIDDALMAARDDLAALVDDGLTEERLATQQAAIASRLEAATRDTRVLAFPARQGPGVARPAVRWLAAAAAAGLVSGLGLGELVTRLPGTPAPAASERRTVARTPAAPAAADELHDERVLEEVELTLSARGVPELAALDALTPVITTVSARSPR